MPRLLYDALFWLAVAACAVAQFFILRAVFRPTIQSPASANSVSADSASAASNPLQRPMPLPHRAQEVAWAILPSLLLGAAFWLAWRHLHAASVP